MSNILDAVGTPSIFSGIKVQHMPICPIQASGFCLWPFTALWKSGRKCLRENSPGNNPQPMTEKQWTFHFCPSRTTEILHCLFWLHRGIDSQWPRPVTYLKMHHLLGSAFSQSHTLIFCLSSASIQDYCSLIIVSGLALRKVPTKIFIIFSEEI